MTALTNWRRFEEHMEIKRLLNRLKGKTNEAKCYRLARDCYRVLAKHDKTKKYKESS